MQGVRCTKCVIACYNSCITPHKNYNSVYKTSYYSSSNNSYYKPNDIEEVNMHNSYYKMLGHTCLLQSKLI